MSADRATDAVEAASTSKILVPRFSSYQPAASSSSNRRHHGSDQQVASSSRSHRRPRKRRRHHDVVDDSAKLKDVPQRTRSSRKDRKGKDRKEGGSSQDGRTSQKKDSHSNREPKREQRSHRTSSSKISSREMSARSPTPPTFDRNLFYTDTRGDRDALVYGQDRSKLPRAHRVFEPAIGTPSRSSVTSTEKQHAFEPPDSPAPPRRGVALEPAEDFIGIDSASSDDVSGPALSPLEHHCRYDQEDGPLIPNTTTLPQPSSLLPSEPSILSLLARRPRETPTGLYDLPLELVHRILVLSRSASLPVASQRLRRACQHASVADKVDYALGRWADHYVAHRTANVCRDKHRACRSFASRLSALWRETPMWYELAGEMLGPSPPCTAHAVRTARLDVITFVAELRVCDPTVLQRVVSAVRASPLPDAVLGDPTLPPLLPKRLFRRIEFSHFPAALDASDSAPPQEATETQADEDQAGSNKTRKRRSGGAERPDTNANETPSTSPGSYPAWLVRLLDSLASVRSRRSPTDSRATDMVGPIPSAADLELLWVLLCSHGADASSHAGYPLAMAVHRGAYALVHMLLLFGADPHCKDGLAAQIAIRNGELDILHLLVTGPSPEVDSIPSEVQGIWSSSRSHRLQLNQTHLRLAIQSKHWNIVDYLWHEQNVSPDIACLKLIEKLRH